MLQSALRSVREGRDPITNIGYPPIPDEIALPLYDAALMFVNAGWQIIKLKRMYQLGCAQHVDAGRNPADCYLSGLKPVYESRIILKLPNGIVRAQDLSGTALINLARDLETAIYIIVAGFTGMRVSEVCALDDDCLGLVAVGETDAVVLKSDNVKTAVVEREATCWVAGAATPDNPVRRAVRILIRLLRTERGKLGTKALFLNTKQPNEGRLTANAMEGRFKNFIVHVPEARNWKLSTHQFRKTFARFVARNDSMAMLALKRHFKHVDIQMTFHYAGMDPLLFDEVLQAKDDYGNEVLLGVLGSDRLAGPLGEIVAQRNSAFRGVAGRDALLSYIERLRNNTDLVILPHRYGLCIYRSDTATCRGDRAKVGVNTCIGCKNFAVSSRHRAYWEERRDSLLAFASSLSDERKKYVIEEVTKANGVLSLI